MKKFKDAALPLLVCTGVFPSYTHAQPAPSPSQSISRSASWTQQNSGTTAGLRGIDSVDGSIAWASGANGTVLKTIDGGGHWSPCTIPDADKDGATLDFRGIQAQDAETAIVMASGPGNKSRLYKTTDGCKSWVLVFKSPTPRRALLRQVPSRATPAPRSRRLRTAPRRPRQGKAPGLRDPRRRPHVDPHRKHLPRR